MLIDAANAAVVRYCNCEFPRVGTVTEYYDYPPPGSAPSIVLRRRPLQSVEDVRVDPRGGYGQLAGTFGSETALTPAVDYYWNVADATLRIIRGHSSWPWVPWLTGYPLGVNARHTATGTIQVTYTAGYTEYPADLLAAIAQIASWLFGTAMESGGRAVTSYLDVSVSAAAAVDTLAMGNVPALGTARQILDRYREMAVASYGRW